MLTRFKVQKMVMRCTATDKGGVPVEETSHTVQLVVAGSTRRHHANDTLWNGLAEGEIYLSGVREEAAQEFRPGREFWVEFRPTDEDPTKP